MEETTNSVTGDEFGTVVQVSHAGTVNVHTSTTSRSAVIGRPISACSPLDLEVHSAGGGPLPPYVRRPHDAVLDRAVQSAVDGSSAVVVLVGGSSTGKTRACWEAVQRLPAPWRLWHPISPGRPQSALADLGGIPAHTVVWLNETHHYLLTPGSEMGEQVAAGLRELLRSTAPLLVLGTLWPEYWQTLTREPQSAEPDPHAQARALLVGTGTRVADEFTATDAAAAAATGDARLVEATLHARDRQVTQYLAGAPALIERFRNAPPGEAAIITAAMDIRRLGHGLIMSANLLEDAAPGYLTDTQWNKLGDHWFTEALTACVQPGKGGSGPLSHVRPRPGRSTVEGYQLEDYLEQRSRLARSAIRVPESTWLSLLTHSASEDHLMLATAARVRGLYRIACLFYLKAGAHQYIQGLLDAGTSHDPSSEPRTIEALRAEAAGVHATRAHAERLLRDGRTEEALRTLDERAQAGIRAAQRMAELLRTKLGLTRPLDSGRGHTGRDAVCDHGAAVRAAAELGDWRAVRRIGGRLLAGGDRDRLLAWLRVLASRYSMSPEDLLLALRGNAHVTDHPVAARRAQDDDWEPAAVLARTAELWDGGDPDELDRFVSLQRIPWRLTEAGRFEEAIEWHLMLTETGHGNQVTAAAMLLRKVGRPAEADRLLRFGIEPGGRIARPWPPGRCPRNCHPV